MGKRDRRKRRERRRERAAQERVRTREAAAIPTTDRSFAFRARGGVTVELPIDAAPVQSVSQPLTPDEARARLLERALGRRPADA